MAPQTPLLHHHHPEKRTMRHLIVFVVLVSSLSATPLLPPCRTLLERGVHILECKGPALSPAILSDSLEDFVVDELHVEGSGLEWLPGLGLEAASAGLKSVRLARCNLGRLVRPAVQSWPALREVEMESVQIQGEPDWGSLLSGAHGLRTLYLRDVSLPLLGRDFRVGVPSGLHFLELRQTGTLEAEAGALAHLEQLVYLSLTETPLSKLHRDVLPAKMERLHTLILSNNEISGLEETFFHGMPKLEVLMISGNRFNTLDSNTFHPIGGQLKHLVANDNPMTCDCSLHWLLTSQSATTRLKVLATCRDPQTRELRDILDLDIPSLCPSEIEQN